MDFFEDVDIASLSEAIDSAEPLEIDGNWLEEGFESEVPRTNPATAIPSSVGPVRTKRKRKGIRGYSTRLLHRKKAELAHLWNEEKELKAWLDQLKNSILTAKVPSGKEKPHGSSSKKHKEWVAKALEEFRGRKRAEAVNRKLKVIQVDQAKVQKSLLEIIQQGSDHQDKNFVFTQPLPPRLSFQVVETYENNVVIAHMRDQACLLLQEPPFAPEHQATVYSSSFETKNDTKRGKMFQSSTFSVVPCSMKTASDALWLEYVTPRKFPFKSYRYVNMVDANSVKKSFDFLLQTQRNSITINGLMFARKFDETRQTTIVRAYTVLLPTAGLRLRCNHWTIVTPSDQGCCVWFFAQLYTEQHEGFTASSKDIKYVEKVALETWSLKMHLYSQHLLDMLMSKAESPTPSYDTMMTERLTC
ncbi:hypothetical protein V7S43_004136 [Phytophthora oleae]|uniref:Ubiquitin-like protease family profile domain-containing protein n=1 Tax=Phytophthora oleae TaxID=2107226 RepID=A0ABD3FXB6_9STRA